METNTSPDVSPKPEKTLFSLAQSLATQGMDPELFHSLVDRHETFVDGKTVIELDYSRHDAFTAELVPFDPDKHIVPRRGKLAPGFIKEVIGSKGEEDGSSE